MPQLINHLGVPADDAGAPSWMTLAVYTCSASCVSPPGESPYMEEFVWYQPE
eukprot:jgi/Botrbrau1/8453/Bobra.0237s0070.1